MQLKKEDVNDLDVLMESVPRLGAAGRNSCADHQPN